MLILWFIKYSQPSLQSVRISLAINREVVNKSEKTERREYLSRYCSPVATVSRHIVFDFYLL